MTSRGQIDIQMARAVASRVCTRIEHACDVLKVGGALRRQWWPVDCVELIAVPKYVQSLFGAEGQSLLDEAVRGMVCDRVELERDASTLKTLLLFVGPRQVRVQIWIVTPEEWKKAEEIAEGPRAFTVAVEVAAFEVSERLRTATRGAMAS